MSSTGIMGVGFHSSFLRRHPLDTAIDKVAAAGYDAIELNAEGLHVHVSPGLSGEERKRLKLRAADAGLAISAVAAHANMVEPDTERRRDNLAYVLGCIDLAADVGAPVAHLLSGNLSPGVPSDDAWAWLVQGVARCIERGQATGVRVGFEPVVNQFVCNVAGLWELMRTLEPLTLYVNFDPSHYQVHGDDPVAAVRTFGARTVHVHVKDAMGTPGNFQFPPLGQGDVDFQGVIAALNETKYQGFLSVEHEADAFGYVETEEAVLRDSLRFVRRLLGSHS